MTLKCRLILHIAVLIAGVLLLGVAAVLGVSALHQDFSLSLRANEQLRQAYTIGQDVASARSAMSSPAASSHLARALAQFEIASRNPWLPGTEQEASAVRDSLQHAQSMLTPASDPSLLDPCYAALADLSAATRRAIEARQASADHKHHLTLLVISLLAATLTFSAWIAAIRLYRSVIRPLTALRNTTRHFAANQLTSRAPTDADEEFATLARDFNQMADELHSLYADLEERVEAKSRQLARSDRLASVGYLAAGVAHEINNPLAIIAGFAERSLQRLSRAPLTEATTAQIQQALQAIRDESFRCKEITTRLLQLSRPGPSARTTFSLTTLTTDILSSVGGLPRFADRRITLDAPPDPAAMTLLANEGELRQVILNLLINALEATDPQTGQIHLHLSSSPASLELSITDNGKGIPPESLPHLFEPFFSDKRADRPGTGLGLSIAHAIVTDHGGSLDVRSAGLNQGATFLLRLPVAVTPEPVHA